MAVHNPFRFGDPVEGEFYLARPDLTQAVNTFLDNRIHVVLIGPRRFGKTSFILDLLKKQEAAGKTCIFIDVFNITSHRDFLQQILRAIRTHKTWKHKLNDFVDMIPRLRPRLVVDQDLLGQTSFSLSTEVSSDQDVQETIQDVIFGIQSLGKNVIVAIDEFQKIAEINDGGWLEATLRTQMQVMDNAVFLFSGSRKSIIHEMINNPNRPLFRFCNPIEFPSFGIDFTKWIVSRFKHIDVECDPESIQKLRADVQDTPNYVQMVCFHMVAQGLSKIGYPEVQSALRGIVKQNSYSYQTILASLSPVQQRALRLTAKETGPIYAKNLLKKYEISSGAALASAIKALKEKQIVDETSARGQIIFDDPLFAIWLRTEFED